MQNDLVPVDDPDDPNRCQGTSGTGQCGNKVADGSRYCSRCDPVRADRKAADVYRLTNAESAERLKHFEVVDTMRLLRASLLMLDVQIEKADNSSPAFNPAVAATIEKLHQAKLKTLKELARLQMERGQMLSKTQSIDLITKIKNMMVEEIKVLPGWEDVMLRVGKRALELIDDAYGDRILM